MRQKLWDNFDDRREQMKVLRTHFAPTQGCLNDSYNQINQTFNNRGATGMENSPRMKEMFVELEDFIENNIGLPQRTSKELKLYKGTAKKWQILDEACFDRDQIEKLQASVNAPSAQQLDEWKEKHDSLRVKLPATNETVSQWRDEATYLDSADFDP